MIDELEFRVDQLKAFTMSYIEDPVTYNTEKDLILRNIIKCVNLMRKESLQKVN